MPSIDEFVPDGHKRNPSSGSTSTASTTNTDEAYDTVKRAPPGIAIGGQTQAEADTDPKLTPSKIIVFERGKDGEKARIVTHKPQLETRAETSLSSQDSSPKHPLQRAQSTPKVTQDQKSEECEIDVPRSVSLYEHMKREEGGSERGSGELPRKPKK